MSTAFVIHPRGNATVIPLRRAQSGRIRAAAWSVAIVFGFAQAWTSRFTMNSDGISYLDMADAYLRGGWKMLVNGHWSPMYPWLLGVAKAVVKPSIYWEFTLLHVINFILLLAALAAFEFMLHELNKWRHRGASADGNRPLPDGAFFSLGYLLFLSLTLTLIGMERPSPDVLMSVFLYVAIGILLRIRSGSHGWQWFALLGFTLALAYYAKSPMFPLAFVFFAAALFLGGKPVQGLPRVLLAFVVFSLASLPLVIGISRATGHLSFGEAGRWNYLVEVNKAGPVWYMQDPGTAKGKFVHPPQKIFDSPPAYAFMGPVGGTLPVWFDPAYWAAGPKPRFHPHEQISVLLKNAGICFDLIFKTQAAIAIAILILFLTGETRASLLETLKLWPAWLPVLIALFMYCLVLVQERYIAVLFIILWVVLLAGVRLRGESKNLVFGVTCAALIVIGMPVALSAAGDLRDSMHRHHSQWDLARQLRGLGVASGDRVARIGGAHRVEWARLLRLHVIAEVPQEQAAYFWSSPTGTQEQLLEKLRETGATAVVAQQMEHEVFTAGPGWRRLGQGDFFLYMLSPNGASSQVGAAKADASADAPAKRK